MDASNFERYLADRYQDQVKWYAKKSSLYKRYYQCCQWIAIVTSTSIPVLVVSISGDYKWFTAGLSVILAVVTNALKTFKIQENWLNYRTIAETLKKEQHYYDANADEYAGVENREQRFVERVEAIISMENTLWMGLHQKRENKRKMESD